MGPTVYIGKYNICIYTQVLDNLQTLIYKQRDVMLHTYTTQQCAYVCTYLIFLKDYWTTDVNKCIHTCTCITTCTVACQI